MWLRVIKEVNIILSKELDHLLYLLQDKFPLSFHWHFWLLFWGGWHTNHWWFFPYQDFSHISKGFQCFYLKVRLNPSPHYAIPTKKLTSRWCSTSPSPSTQLPAGSRAGGGQDTAGAHRWGEPQLHHRVAGGGGGEEVLHAQWHQTRGMSSLPMKIKRNIHIIYHSAVSELEGTNSVLFFYIILFFF